MSELTPIIQTAFTQYSGAVLQSRALVDVRDCLKPSARQIFYALYTDKYLHNKPYKKTLKAVGSLSRFYIHGDSSAVGVLMRAGQNFAMRYPIMDIRGNAGTLMESGNWAHQRYTESRLSEMASQLFTDVDKDTIIDWRDNYDDTEQYPSVLPTKGFYNIVNGTMGIGIGMSSSIPQFNITDVNNALIHLIQNPDCDFEEIYCAPDFATGAVLLNESEVKESLKNGTGSSCRLRSVVDFNSSERALVVTEIPYGVYTNTICAELEAILNDENANPGIERFNDLTGATPLIKIYLAKKANPDRVLKYLFKNTSLQSWYSINMTMLENGRFPRVFGWKEALQSHINHEKEVYRRAYEFDMKKMKDRVHILNGLLICMASIDEVVNTIKNSSSSAAAKIALCSKFLLDDMQAKAVLDLKLSRLAHLEVEKLQKEKKDLEAEIACIEDVLNDEIKFRNELIKGWEATSKKYGDARRTVIMNLNAKDDEEPTEIKTLQISLSNKNNLYLTEVSSLYAQKRGGVGNKAKLESGEYVMCTQSIESNEEVMFFTQTGDFYHYPAANLPIGERIAIESLFAIKDWEKIKTMVSLNKKTDKSHILFFTKHGFVKKSLLSEYNMKRSGSLKAITLEPGDEIIDIIITDNDNVGILTDKGNFLTVTTNDINAVGRIAKGVRAIKLNDGDCVVSARAVPKATKYIVSVTSAGLIKSTPKSEFGIQNKNTKGAKIQKLVGDDTMASFLPIVDETEVLVASTRACIKMSINDIPILSKMTQGNKAIKLGTNDEIVEISHC